MMQLLVTAHATRHLYPDRLRAFVAGLAVAAASLFTFLPSAALAADVTPEQQASALARPAVVYLEVHWTGWVRDPSDGQYFNDGDPIEVTAACTGFNLNPDGYLATAGHCVDPGPEGVSGMFISEVVDQLVEAGIDASPAELFEVGMAQWQVEGETAGSPPDRQVFAQWGVAASGLTSGTAQPARVVDFRPVSQGDVALLKVEQHNLPALEVTPGSEVEIGSHLVAVGYPGSAEAVSDQTLEPTNKDGTVSAKRTDGGVPVYEVSAAATGGMSGGPAVDNNGKVIGLVSRGPAGETQAFNFITPSDTVREILSRNGVENKLGPVDTAYRQGLDLFFAGQYRAASDQFDQALALLPSHQQAQDYKQRAAEAIASGQDRPTDQPKATPVREVSKASSPVPLALLGLGVLGAGGAGTVILARRRRQPASVAVAEDAIRLDGAGSGPVSAGELTALWPVNGPGGSERALDRSPVALAEPSRFCGSCGAGRQPESAGSIGVPHDRGSTDAW
jgi:S1-C subfamily serine protease